MYKSENQNHHLVAIYEDAENQGVNSMISSLMPEKDTRILAPQDHDALTQAAQNSSLVIIVLENAKDQSARLVRMLKDNRMVVADVIAVVKDPKDDDLYALMAKGFDLCVSLKDCQELHFKAIFKQKVLQGTKRLSGFILEEEYRRFSDALSCAPTSVIVFDQEKRIVFVSEHYFRAYPKSAPRLFRGLSVYDAFDMMSKEEELSEDDPRYEDIRQFWYSLSGDIEFTLDNGVSYRLKAVSLPNERGAIVTAQNITEYVQQNKELKTTLDRLKKAESKA